MRAIIRFILITALLIQALIPVGYMPSFTKDSTTLEICSGLTNQTIKINSDNNQPHHSDDTPSNKCPYFSIGGFTHSPYPTLQLIDTSFVLLAVDIDDLLSPQSFSTSNHKTGPPHISLA